MSEIIGYNYYRNWVGAVN